MLDVKFQNHLKPQNSLRSTMHFAGQMNAFLFDVFACVCHVWSVVSCWQYAIAGESGWELEVRVQRDSGHCLNNTSGHMTTGRAQSRVKPALLCLYLSRSLMRSSVLPKRSAQEVWTKRGPLGPSLRCFLWRSPSLLALSLGFFFSITHWPSNAFLVLH